MNIEHLQLALQIISVICVPLLTVLITWITSSLKKTNHRIDEMEKRYNKNRIDDLKEMSQLNSSMEKMLATQQAVIREMSGTNKSVERITDFLLNGGKTKN